MTARKELPAEATVVELIDAMQYANLILGFMKPVLEASGAKLDVKLPEPVPVVTTKLCPVAAFATACAWCR